jgi:O-antigen/teichoic acid export membrane protein
MTERYRLTNIRKGFYHFVGGKALTAVTGILALLLVVRTLPIEQYATYAVFSAFIMIFSALSGFGLAQIGQRYIPEFGEQGNYQTLRKLIYWVVWARWLVALIALWATYILADPIVSFLKILPWLSTFKFYLIVVFLRVAGLHVFQILESMLHQGAAQLGILSSSVIKLILIVTFYIKGDLYLNHVIWADLAGDLLGLIVLSSGIFINVRRITLHSEAPHNAINIKKMIRFGVTGYLRDLAYLLYGSSANRLVASRYLAANGVASIGFAQSLADIVRRYLPVQLLQGLLQPVMMARYARGKGTQDLVQLVNFAFKLNLLLLALPMVTLIVAGAPAISWLTIGKYHSEANTLLLIFMVAIIGESLLLLLDLVAQAVERNEIILIGNLVLSSSMLIAIPMIPTFGSIAIPLANAFGVVVASIIVLRGLKIYGVIYQHDWRGNALVLVAVLFGVLAGSFALAWSGIWLLAMMVSALVYMLGVWFLKPLNPEEITLMRKLLKKRSSAESNAGIIDAETLTDRKSI